MKPQVLSLQWKSISLCFVKYLEKYLANEAHQADCLLSICFTESQNKDESCSLAVQEFDIRWTLNTVSNSMHTHTKNTALHPDEWLQ